MNLRRGIRLVLVLAIGLLALAAARAAPGSLVRDHYVSIEDCTADWGSANCERLLSSGYAGGAFVFRGPPYEARDREPARRQSQADSARRGGTAVDAARAGRAIATVREPPALDGARPRAVPPAVDVLDDAPPDSVPELLAGLPYFVAYYGVALMLLTIALALHVLLAARRELALIRSGNAAVAASMTGVLVGFALPLSRVMDHSETLLQLLAWGGVALLVQLVVVVALRFAMRALTARVREGQLASGVFLGALAIALGLLNAAALGAGF